LRSIVGACHNFGDLHVDPLYQEPKELNLHYRNMNY
jgi:hypothetical protein